jgi:hypothetical protein
MSHETTLGHGDDVWLSAVRPPAAGQERPVLIAPDGAREAGLVGPDRAREVGLARSLTFSIILIRFMNIVREHGWRCLIADRDKRAT